MGSFLLLKSLLLAACALGLEAAHENEILNSFREFLNNLPNQDHFYTDGVVLNIGNMDNNKQNIEIHLHASRIDPKTTKLVKCTGTVHRKSDGTIQIYTESGYKCTDDIITPKQYKSDVRVKRQSDLELDPTEPKYQKLADEALEKYIREKKIKSGPYLRARVYRVRGVALYPPNGIIRIDFDVDNIKDSYEHYVCTVDTGHLSLLFVELMDVSCEPRFTGLIHRSHH